MVEMAWWGISEEAEARLTWVVGSQANRSNSDRVAKARDGYRGGEERIKR